MSLETREDPRVRYWLRVVRIGLLVTTLTLAALAAVPFLPHRGQIPTAPFMVILAIAALGALGIWALPWQRLFERGLGMWFLYGWSTADIMLVTAAVAISGGGSSELFVIYALTTVFFGASYPLRGQVGLLAFTFACYLAVLGWTGWHVMADTLFIRLSTLAILALLANFLSGELMRQMEAADEARTRAERWASMVATVAAAARNMTLDPDRVADVVVDAVVGLGFDGGGLCALDPDGRTYRVIQARGVPDGFAGSIHPTTEGLTGMVLRDGRTVVVDDYQDRPEAIATLKASGFRSAMGSPVWVDGWLAAVLIAGSRRDGRPPEQEVEALELLAAEAAMALENARRFEQEHHAVQRLEELDRLKSDFLATVSHELRTPVTVIEGVGLTLEATWERLDEQTRRDLLARMATNARALDTLINNLLDFSRLESGQPDVHLARVDLSTLLRRIAMRLEPQFAEHVLTVDVDAALCVKGDAVFLERVVENLLGNAVKHTPAGTRVCLSAHPNDVGIRVSVSDDGPGIPEEEQRHLGERFFRGGDLNTRVRGLGLGLALAREILDQHGSELQVESGNGHGATFWFDLVALDVAAPTLAGTPLAGTPLAGTPLAGTPDRSQEPS